MAGPPVLHPHEPLACVLVCYSHAILESKDVSAMANACMGERGHCKSMVNVSLPMRPNCSSTRSPSPADSISWKFFTLGSVTRPLKFSTYARAASFHLGVLFVCREGKKNKSHTEQQRRGQQLKKRESSWGEGDKERASC